ncbi:MULTISPECIES: acylneuraminate cytidylyltransferase family protein [Flavobacteriaceae]|uniref:N-acylneuraminate cytidylyltransferase n=2 Tax=Flavobacteriaceae TaxID=49546 RepID=A0A4R8MJF0_9FLAO|nr:MULTISPECIES: acylneuraminate cytidylyltransferase family protein [Flavobacteriaceae]MWW24832.1 acylneuraminate cytidylyltransferase family protein [Algibacter lectus]TDY64757.1 N-acylneuraminate cytidylyltransferase [Algibacter lectus]SFJ09426.1 N-acylneuraminate cytidylyltransferase [Olleya namhaensis]
MKTIIVIPARGGSKRLPNKNVLALGDLPLIAHSILYAKANLHLADAIYITTDDATIKEIALSYGVNVIDRPSEISGDLEPTVSAVKHVLESINETVETVILLQPTNPLRPKTLLEDCINAYNEKACDSVFTVSQSHHKLGKIENDKFKPFNYTPGQRSQDLEPLFFENGLLYITNATSVLNNEIMTTNGFPFKINHEFSTIDIDTQADLDYANYILEKSNLNLI